METVINYNQLVNDNTPDVVLNHYDSSGNTIINTRVRDWNCLLVGGIATDYNTFTDYYNDTLFKVSHNGQLLSLEHYLNNEFLPTFPPGGSTIYTSGGTVLTSGQIYIEDGNINLNTYLFNDSEIINPTLTTYLFNVNETGSTLYTNTYLYNIGENNVAQQIDFVVFAPNYLVSDTGSTSYIAIDSAVRWYKPAGTTYQISGYSYSFIPSA